MGRDTRAPSRIGPYEIGAPLGEGGAGIVYAARGPSHIEVALKLTRARTELSAFELMLEAQALSDLDHPGVVRVMDHGEYEGRPWYAMPLLRGPTLRDLLLEHPEGLPVTRAQAILRALCGPLAYVHGRGLVHRDLKPENIFVLCDDEVMLVDFGLAGRFGSHGRERLERGGRQVGSQAYMAPEQVKGRFVDARADLYALGCVLYELLLGRPPFGDGPDTLRGHLREAPSPVSRSRPEVPPELDRLVSGLLQKDPRARIGYARDVCAGLDALGASAPPDSFFEADEPYLYRPELSGRAARLEVWQELVEDALDGERRLVLVTGESGVGKTRLCSEMGERAARAGLVIWLGEATDPSSGPPGLPLSLFESCFTTLGEVLRSHPDKPGQLLGSHAACALAIVPQWSDLGDRVGRPPPGMPAKAVQQAGLTALVALVRRYVEREPACLLLDDLQWADPLSVELLVRLAGDDAPEAGLLMLGAYRMEEGHEHLASLREVAAPWELERLGPEALAEMIGGMLSVASAPAALVEFIEARTAGNPFFVAEYLRGAMQSGLLHRDANGWSFSEAARQDVRIPLPKTLAELVAGRLARLPERGLRLVEVMSVFGRTAPVQMLFELDGIEEQEGLRILEQLRVQQVVQPRTDGTVAFVHDQLRAAAYPESTRARALHEGAAEAFERRYSNAPEQAATIAEHFARAERPARAARPYLAASRYAEGRYAPDDALRWAEAALTQAMSAGRDLPGPVVDEIRERLFDLRLQDGQTEAAVEVLAAGPTASEAPTNARWLRKQGNASRTAHDFDGALGRYDAAEAHLEGASGHEVEQEWLQLQMERVAALYWTGRDAARAEIIEAIRPALTKRLPPAAQLRFYQGLVQHGVRRDRYRPGPETLGHAAQVLEIAERAGAEAQILEARFGLGAATLWAGQPAQARLLLEPTERLADRRGDRALALRCAAYLSTAARQTGDLELTQAAAGRVLEAARALDMKDYEGLAEAHRAWLAGRQSCGAQAHELAMSALSLWQSLPMAYPFSWCARLVLVAHAESLQAAQGQASAIIELSQQRLPPALEEALQTLADGPASFEEGRRDVVMSAKSSGHL